MTDPQTERTAEIPSDGRETGALFHALTTDDPSPEAAYTAVKEVESMAGENVVAQLTAHTNTVAAELNAKIDRVAAEVNARIEAMNRQFRVMWALQLAILAMLTALILRV